MKIVGTRLALAVLITFGVVGSIAPNGAVAQPPRAAQTPESSGGSPFAPVADCIKERKRLAVLMVVDQSGSLDDTDPDDVRVVGLEAALAGLTELSHGDEPTEVVARVAGFDVGYQGVSDWQSLDYETVGDLREQAQVFAQRDNGFDTDYIAALAGAQQELAEKTVAMDPDGTDQVCKLLLLFTDGKFDIDDRKTDAQREQHGETKPWATDRPLTEPGSGDALVEVGKDLLCRPDGLMDDIRSSNVFSAVVALETAIASEDRSFLSSMATGRAGNQTCGTPEEAAGTGAYVPATNLDELIEALLNASMVGGRSGGVSTVYSCPADQSDCPKGTMTFELDSSLNRFNVLAIAADPAVDVNLKGPAGDVIKLARGAGGSKTVSQATIRWTWLSPTAVLISGDLPGASTVWIGTWGVTFVDTSGTSGAVPNRISIYVFGDIEAKLSPNTTFQKGEAGTFEVSLVNAAGQPRTPDAFRRGSTLVAKVGPVGGKGEEVPLERLPDGRFESTYTPDVDLTANKVTVRLELTTQTSFGIALPTVSTEFAVPLKNPAGFPQIDIGDGDELRLSSIDADSVAEGTFKIVAGPEGAGCVWFVGAKVADAPGSAGKVTFAVDDGSSEDDCVAVKDNETKVVTLSADPAGTGSGSVSGEVELRLKSSVNDKQRSELLPVGFEMSRPLDIAKQWTAFAVLLAAGLLIPIIVMYLLNVRTARFEKFDTLRFAVVDLVVGPAGVARADGTAPLIGGEEDIHRLFNPDRKEFDAGGFEFTTVVPKLPISNVWGRVRFDGSAVLSDRGTRAKGGDAVVGLGLGRTWVFAVDADDLRAAVPGDQGLEQPVTGRLIAFFLSSSGDGSAAMPFAEQVEQLIDRVGRNLPDGLRTLANRLPAAPGVDATPPPPPPPGLSGSLPGDDVPAGGPHRPYNVPGDGPTAGRPPGSSLPGDGPGRPSPEPRSDPPPDPGPGGRPSGGFRLPD